MYNDSITKIDKKSSAEINPKKGKQLIFQDGFKISKGLKSELKKVGCRWSVIYQRYIFPSKMESEIEKILDLHKAEASIQDVIDFFSDSKVGNKILNLQTRLSILEKNEYENSLSLHQDLNKYEEKILSRHGKSLLLTQKKLAVETIKQNFLTNDEYRFVLEMQTRAKKIGEIKNQVHACKTEIENLKTESADTILAIECLSKNEVGDAEIFVRLFKEKYIFDPTEGKNGQWFIYRAGFWEIDLSKKRYHDFQKIAEVYLIASEDVEDDKLSESLRNRALSLHTQRRRTAVLETASAYLPFKEKWDQITGKLPCKNGIIDLKTGKIEDHYPKNFIKKICPVKYSKKSECPRFETFINEITLGEEALSSFIQRIIGYAVTGYSKEEIIILLHGEEGRNGKGTLMFVLEKILGSIFHTFSVEMLLQQRNTQSSSAASPDLALLEGCRLAIFSEVRKKRKLDTSKVKNLSGRDTISTRRLFSNIDLQISPTHVMFIQTNHMPEAPSDDEALWERCIVIPFNARFVREPKKENEFLGDPDIKEKLIEEKEGILKWIIEGSQAYHEIGLKIPDSVQVKTQAYRKANDSIGNFIEMFCVLSPEFSCQAKKLYDKIKEFSLSEEIESPSRNEIMDYLEKNIGLKKVRTKNGAEWKGISIEPEG